MTVYSYAQLETLWINAGGPKALAPIAAAIGEAESGGNSDALNPNDNGGRQSSFGIWQISNGTHTPPDPNWANPAVNARLAVGKWKGAGNSFSPWGTYGACPGAAYCGFLSNKTAPDPNVPGSPTGVSAQVSAQGSIDCLVGNPFSASIGFGPVSIGSSIGPSCLFTRSNARAFIGAGLLVWGGMIGLAGIVVLAAAAGMKAAGPIGKTAETVGGAMLLIPGAEGAGVAVAGAGKAAQSAGKGKGKPTFRQRAAADDGQAQLGEPRENPDLEIGGGTVRETGGQRAARKRREQAAARARARRSAGQGRPASREEAGF